MHKLSSEAIRNRRNLLKDERRIETNVTINLKIGGNEFILTQEEAEELYNSLQNSLGKNDLTTRQTPIKECEYEELFKQYEEWNPAKFSEVNPAKFSEVGWPTPYNTTIKVKIGD